MKTIQMVLFTLLCAPITAYAGSSDQTDQVKQVPAVGLEQYSALSGPETRAVLERQAREAQEFASKCPLPIAAAANLQDIEALRRCYDEYLFPAYIARQQARYSVKIESQAIGGVPTEIFTPTEGLTARNQDRVLINLHGGAFIMGGRWVGEVESIPIASVGKIKVVSVDYRLGPEHRFPTASEDVAAVYKALMKQYRPENIGIYGCSAGGVITAEAVAWFLKQQLPSPGAIGIFCAGAQPFGLGDSERIGSGIPGKGSLTDALMEKNLSYFEKKDLSDALAFPALSPAIMARFPDTLIISSTRDYLLSSAVSTHSQLVKLGVSADLHVWEGLAHGFINDPELPEAREAYDVITRFFAHHLGRTRKH
jgi:monoterpene epsilon-lactone hydrolase